MAKKKKFNGSKTFRIVSNPVPQLNPNEEYIGKLSSKIAIASDRRNITNLGEAADQGDAETVLALLNQDADVNATDEQNITAVMKAAKNGHIDVVRILLEHGAQIEDHQENSALVWAAWGGHLGVVELLLENGADITATDESGNTALFDAARMGHLEIVRTLLAGGAKLSDSTNPTGNALSWAERKGHQEIVELLSAEAIASVPSSEQAPTKPSSAAEKPNLPLTNELTPDLRAVLEAFQKGMNPFGDDIEVSEKDMEIGKMFADCIMDTTLPSEEIMPLKSLDQTILVDEVHDDPLSKATENGGDIFYDKADGSRVYVQRRSELSVEKRLQTAQNFGESRKDIADANDLYLAATSKDISRVKYLLGDTDAHRLFAMYFQRHRFGVQPPVMFYLSMLPPNDRVKILEYVVTDDSKNLDVYDKLAMAYLKSGRRREAHKRLEKALSEGNITGAFFN